MSKVASKPLWRAGWHEVGAERIYFRSLWEANYSRYLEWLRVRGDIKAWSYEKETFWFDKPVTVGGRRLTGVRRGVNSYKPDFSVDEPSGKRVYHEVKGFFDSRSKTTLSRMARYYPEITVIVIDKRQYESVASRVKHLVPGWQ